MRLDKYLTECGLASRSESSRAARAGRITVNGTPVRDASLHIDPENDTVVYCGERAVYRRYTYVMLNKPQGYVSATEDPRQKTVLDLLDSRLRKIGLFPCGRLDSDTTGLMILTDNGDAAHRRLSPRHHAEKVYRFCTERPVEDTETLERGIRLADGYVTAPCKIRMLSPCEGEITLTEGKYHQIKRMFAATGNRITALRRIAFAGIELDPNLPEGQWRFLTPEEQEKMEKD